MHSCEYIHTHVFIQPIACGVSILKCQKYVYIRIYIDAYAQLWIHTYTCVYTAYCMWSVYIKMPKACIYTHIHRCICTAMDTYIYMCVYCPLHVECLYSYAKNMYTYTYTSMHMHSYGYVHMHVYIQPIACGVSFNQILQSQSNWSLFNGTWQTRRRELDDWLRLEIAEMTLQMQWAVPSNPNSIAFWHFIQWQICI